MYRRWFKIYPHPISIRGCLSFTHGIKTTIWNRFGVKLLHCRRQNSFFFLPDLLVIVNYRLSASLPMRYGQMGSSTSSLKFWCLKMLEKPSTKVMHSWNFNSKFHCISFVMQPWASRCTNGSPRIGPLSDSPLGLTIVGQPIDDKSIGPNP